MRLALSFSALFLSVIFLQLSSGALGPLDALSGLQKEFSKTQVGLLGSAHFFGFFIGVLSCYTGYNTNKGAEGVGMATNSAVILSSLSIFIIDLIAVQITEIIIR